MKTREQIISKARVIRREIEQIFLDADHWNRTSRARAEGCDPINPDPDGQLRRIADGIDRMLAVEDARHPPQLREEQ